ncbi:MAG: imidazole glycerol phosphate synthase subunit HisH [Actinobacteria bacterium]|nr:imidazole glycerol phosphate synthase subunit HisH [Actinomycetota bacterium]
MSKKQVVVIDYGMGNLWSVASAIRYLGAEALITSNTKEISSAKFLILPGVGSFRRAMQVIKQNSIDQAILQSLSQSETKLLGICLGMQLLGSTSSEDGDTQGLGLVPNTVQKFTNNADTRLKIPHVGFSEVKHGANTKLFSGIPSESCFYFVHSYFMKLTPAIDGVATCHHGGEFVAAFEQGQVSGTQFHPEKSQSMGLNLLKNFLES